MPRWISSAQWRNASMGWRTGSGRSSSSAGTGCRRLRTEAISSSKQAVEIIGAQGMTPDHYQDVAYSIGMSLAADEMKKTPEELVAARKKQDEQLAAMKDQISPEQYAQLKQQLAMADRMVAEFKKMPAGNVELVRKHATAIKAAVGQSE